MFGHGRTPRIEVLELTKDRVKFLLSNTDTSVANALRRIMIAEVPTLAIELVSMEENSSCLQDEFIAHRLGLLPIDSRDIESFNYRQECVCVDKCSRCCAEYQLDVICKDSHTTMCVTHYDLEAVDSNPRIIIKDDHRTTARRSVPMPVPHQADDFSLSTQQGGILIAKLQKQQAIKCRLVAQKGLGKIHAKFCPVATAVWQFEPDISFNSKLLNSCPTSIKQKIVESCPRGVFALEIDKLTGQSEITVQDKMVCNYCEECISTANNCNYKDLIKITTSPDKFHFSVESTGSLPPETIVTMALNILEEKLKKIKTAVAEVQGVGGTSRGGQMAEVDDFLNVQLD